MERPADTSAVQTFIRLGGPGSTRATGEWSYPDTSSVKVTTRPAEHKTFQTHQLPD